MRFGIYGLAGLVRNELGFDSSGGDVFVFLGKRLKQIRLLQWDRDGFAMYVKSLNKALLSGLKGKRYPLPASNSHFFYKE